MDVLKLVLMWLLLFAIPMQGVAGNAMAICQAAQQRIDHASASYQAMGGHVIDRQDTTMHHREHRVHRHADTADAMADHHHAGSHELAKSDGCTACGAGALWVNVANITLPVIEPASSLISYIAFHIPAVIPDLPEPPPRSRL